MSQNPDTALLYRQLREAKLTGNHPHALSLLQQIVARDPSDREAAAQLAAASPSPAPENHQEYQNPDTAPLYRQLRGAKLTGDHTQALRLLQQIVIRDPSDQKAAAQLATYAQPVTKTSDAEDARTRGLFQKLRAACLNQNDLEAFQILKQILDITPQNAYAQQQKKEIGKRLSAVYAEDLDSLLATGDETAIFDRVTQMREYADDEYLSRYDSYAAAVGIAHAVHERHMRSKLDEMMAALEGMKSLDERHEHALSISRFASENQVSLSQKEKDTISDILEKWKSEQHRLELLRTVEEARHQFEQAVAAHVKRDLAIRIQLLEQLCDRAAELTEVDEGEKLLNEAKSALQKMRSEHQIAVARRKMVERIRAVVILLVLAFIGVTTYVVVSVDEKTTTLAAYRTKKNPVSIQKELQINRFFVVLYTHISAEYATEYEACQKYLQEWQKGTAHMKELTDKLRTYTGKVTSENILQITGVLVEIAELEERLVEQYGYEINETQKRELETLLGEIQKQQRLILREYQTPRNYAHFKEAAARLQSFIDIHQVLPYGKDEVDSVIAQFRNDITRAFSDICTSHPDKVGEWLRDYDATLAPYEKHLHLREDLISRARYLEEWYALPDKLADCETLDAYLSQLSASAPLLKGYGDVEDPKALHSWAQKADTYAQQEKLKSSLEASHAARLYQQDSLESLKILQNVYRRGESLFPGSRPFALNAVIDRMTESSPHWPQEISQVEFEGCMYMGRVYQVNDKKGMIIEGSEKIRLLPGSIPIRKLHMAEARTHAGMKRMNLQCGLVTPATLMANIVGLSDNEAPALAKAYLFSLAVEMMDKLGDPLLSGIHFSPSLAADVKRFQELSLQSQLFDGCWMKPYSAEQEKTWANFFRSLGSSSQYSKEIEWNVEKILSAHCVYVGYIAPNGRPVFLDGVDTNVSLYTPDKSGLLPWRIGTGKPFAPILTIK